MPANSILRSTSVIAATFCVFSDCRVDDGCGHHRFGTVPLASAWMKPKAAESLEGWKNEPARLMTTEMRKTYWCSGSLLPGSAAGKVGLLDTHRTSAVGAEIEESRYGLGYGGSRRGRYHRHRRKRFYPGGRRLPMKPRGVSSRRLSLLIGDDAGTYRETVEAGAWILTDGMNIDEAVRMANDGRTGLCGRELSV